MSAKRRKELEKEAHKLGMSFSEKDDWGLIGFLKDFKLFRKGFGKRVTNVMHAQDDWLKMEARVFDYRYTIHSGKSSRVFRQTVFFMQSKQLGLPEFLLKPENIFHKIGQLLGMQDIDFEEYPAFSNQYLLKGDDEDYIRATMNDQVLKFFTVEKNWTLEGVNYYLLFYRNNKLLHPSQIRRFYQKGLKICEMLSQDKII